MSLRKYFKPVNTNVALDAVPVAATIAELTTQERNEVENAIRGLENRNTHECYSFWDYYEKNICKV